MIYIENIFHISLMENRDGILTEEGKKAKENKESNTHTLSKSMKHSFQNKKNWEEDKSYWFPSFFFLFFKEALGSKKKPATYSLFKETV